MKKMLKNRGITLIALVITIIVLLILAGITIAALTGDNGILTKTKEASSKTGQSTAEEEVQISWMSLHMNNSNFDDFTLEHQAELLKQELENTYPGADTKIIKCDEENKVIEISHRGYNVKINTAKTGNISSGGNTSGGSSSGGNTSSSGNTSGGSSSGGNTSGGSSSGGNTSSGGSSSGGSTEKPDTTTYTISFETNGGNSIDSQKVKKGEKLTKPADPIKNGFSFGGWYEDQECNTLYNFNNTIISNMTLYAKWTNETNKDYFEWITTSKYATLLGFSDSGKAAYNNGEITELLIPEVYNGLTVSKINTSAFKGCDKINKLVIPKGVETLLDNAFYGCSNIKEISLPIAINYTSNSNVFYGCTGINKVTLTPGQNNSTGFNYTTSTYTYTPWYYSKQNSIEVNIKAGIEKIGAYTFYQNTGVKKVTIEDGVENCGDNTFYGCTNLKTAEIGCKKIGTYAFSGCTGLQTVNLTNNVNTIGKASFYNCTGLLVATIGDGVNNIEDEAFKGCSSLELEYNNPNIEQIGNSAFYECKGIRGNLDFAKNTINIGNNAFYRCTGITGISFEKVISIGDNAFDSCTYLTSGVESLKTAENIGNNAFSGCNDLKGNINLSNIRTIGNNAFNGKIGITGTIETEKIESVGESAFNGCTGLTKVTLKGEKNAKIGALAFYGCSGIKEIEIGENVTKIDGPAFSKCTGLNKVTIPISLNASSYNGSYSASYGYYTFSSDTNLTEITFTKGTGIGYSYSSGYGDTPWYYSKDKDITITIQEGITSIGENMFYGCTGITNLTMPSTVTKVENNAFYNCTKIANEVDISNLTEIGDSAFYNCKNMKGNWNISTSLTQIPQSAFYNCSARKGELNLDNVTSIGYSTFSECSGITGNIKIKDIENISESIFFECTSIEKVEIGTKTKTIGNQAFNGCSGVKEIIIGDNVTKIDGPAFGRCVSATKLTIPISLNASSYNSRYSSSYGYYTFSSDTNLTEITFTKGTGIGYEYSSGYDNTPWYYSRNNDISVTIEEGIDDIGTNMFYRCTGLKYINIAKIVTKIGNSAFEDCNNIRIINYAGTSEEWKKIQIGSNNTSFTDLKPTTVITKNNGTCNTGIKLEGNYKIETKIKLLSNSNGYNYIYGTGSSDFETYIDSSDSKLHFTNNGTTTNSKTTLNKDTSYTITEEVNNGTMKASINGEECINTNTTAGTSGEVKLFASANGNCSGNFGVEYLKIYKDENLVLELVPIITRYDYEGKKSEKQGFYDKVSKRFLYSNNKEFGLEGGILICNGE